MLTHDQADLLEGIPDDARVWIYQADRKLNNDHQKLIKEELNSFINDWKAHGNDLKAAGELVFDQFVILGVDERQAIASGCSIDSSVRKMKELSDKLEVDFFNRSNIAYVENEDIRLVPFQELRSLFEMGVITGETVIFDNTIQKANELRIRWMVRLKDSPAWQLVK
jgi:hypothetical protein